MPRLFGLSIAGILAAGVAYWLLGALWYGVLFMEPWMAAVGIEPSAEEPGAIMYVIGLGISLLSAAGMAWALQRMRVSEVKSCVLRAIGLFAGFGLPALLATIHYQQLDWSLLWIDGSYVLIGFVIMAAILALFGTQPKMKFGDSLD